MRFCPAIRLIPLSLLCTWNLFAQEPVVEVLEAASVSAAAPSISVVGDTLVFSASAYRLAEDASLEDLLKKISGIEVQGSTVLLLGKPIKELRINGKRYFGGDLSVGLQNIPADMVDKIGAYEMESDFSRLTGVDDGELVPVLDVKIKQHFMDKWKGRVTGGLGTTGRYLAKTNANKITGEGQLSFSAHFHNLPGKASFNNATRTQLGGGAAGESAQRQAGFSFSKKTKEGELDWNVQYQGRTSAVQSRARTQNIYAATTSFSNGDNSNLLQVDNPKADLRFLFRPGKQSTLLIKPSIAYSRTDSWNHQLTDNYRDEPYGMDAVSLASLRTSSADNLLKSFSGQLTAKVVLIWTRRFSKKGRTFSIQTDNVYSTQMQDQGTNYRTVYNRTKSPADTTRRQYIDKDARNLSLSLQAAWNEPVTKGLYVQLSVRGEYKERFEARSLYDLTRVDNAWQVANFSCLPAFLSSLPSGLDACFQHEVSYSGHYRYFAVVSNINMRYVKKTFSVTAGIRLTPTFQEIVWPDLHETMTRSASVCYLAPNLTMNYKPSRRSKLTLNYKSSVGQPSIYNLLPVSNGTNPLSVHIGNPDIKPSNTHVLDITYNASNFSSRSSITGDMQFKVTENAVSNSTGYDPETGAKTVIPKNISGNWFVQGHLALTKELNNTGFSFGFHSSARHDNNVNYLYNKTLKVDEVNTTRRTMLKGFLRTNYRNSWREAVGDVGGDYTLEKSLLRPDMNQHPWSFVGTLSVVASAPWGMRFNTDYTCIVQKGFVYDQYNGAYHVLNVGLSQHFLKKRLVVKLEAVDVLGQLPNIVRRFSAESRTVSVFNGVNSYALLRLVWKLG